MTARTRLFCAAAIAAVGAMALSGCKSRGEIVVQEGVGITAVRGACPAVGIPDYTGDVTLFRTAGARDAASVDVTATMTNVRSQCSEDSKDASAKVYSGIGFDVLGRRTDARGARQVSLPYFITVLRGGRAVVTKRVGTVVLNFADGQERAQAHGEGGAFIDRAEATLPDDIRNRITRKRKAGDQDAAVDRTAVQRATFEVLVGFQLDQDQLSFNATK
jgi:hypothetical protein